MSQDWTPAKVDPARRLFQVRRALNEMPYIPHVDRVGMEELAANLERKLQPAPKGKR